MHRPWCWWRCRIEFPISKLLYVAIAKSVFLIWLPFRLPRPIYLHEWIIFGMISIYQVQLPQNWFRMHFDLKCTSFTGAWLLSLSLPEPVPLPFQLHSSSFVVFHFSPITSFHYSFPVNDISQACSVSVLYTCTFCLPVIILVHMKYNRIQFQFTVHCACNTHFFCCSQLWRRWCTPQKNYFFHFVSFSKRIWKCQ